VLSTLVADVVRPLLEQEPLCSGLRRQLNVGFAKIPVAVDKTAEVRLRSLQYCPAERDSRLTANISLRCETPPKAVLHLSLSATFHLDMTVDNRTCAITAFRIEAETRDKIVREIVRLLVAKIDLTNKIRAEVARNISVICQASG